ncbi:CD3337/EF1877 family mobilome membrane protein [Sinanaerobacter sp. ZZT-01]|uniref:CD3337/EF1877 family mobilome membrane protein n=1 Tax=Sinanaerobacter sp. ZZT-01 TaxID=3111540 RepID=UPI002D79EC9F|nr:hypothetical protein [Sinanaerobacter sp. ZZT-01]WRR94186.1 hypothetical protein U5921_03445 [Sinanaerobacter sp. ZZT-01]
MKKRIILILTCIAILILVCSSAVIFAADSDLYKNIDETAAESNEDYFINYRDNYQLDTEKMSVFKNIGSVICDLFSNILFAIQVLLAKVTISLFSFSLSSNIAVMLGGFLEPFIIAMRGSMWDTFAAIGIVFAAFLLLLKMMQNRTAQAFSSMVALVFIIMLAFAFYAYPIKLLEGVDTVTSGVCETVMEGPYKETVGGKTGEAKGKAASLCWNLLVHQPWQVLEFGSVKMAERHEAEILKLTPDSEQRKDAVEKLAKSDQLFSKSFGYQVGRLVTAIILLMFTLLLMIILMVFSVLIIGYQFLVLVYLLLGIFVFLVALLPNFGLPLVKRWGGRIISISFVRILVVFFLSMTLVFMEVIYKFSDEYGLITSIFLILVIVASIWFERFRLLNLFSSFQSNNSVQMPQSMNKALDQDFNAVNSSRQMWRKMHNQTVDEQSETRIPESTGKMRTETVGSRFGGVETPNINRISDSMRDSSENMTTAVNDMGRYFRQAEELLQKQYEISKEKTEDNADRKQDDVEYGNFVKRTDSIRKSGGDHFDQRDVSAVAHILRSTEMQGGNIKNVVADGQAIYWDKKKEVKRPTNLGAIREHIKSPAGNIIMNEKSKEQMGIAFFKANFGDEMGEDCYEAAAKKYGKNFVDEYNFSNFTSKEKRDSNTKRKASYAEVLKELEKEKRKRTAKADNSTTTQKMRKNEVNNE